MIRELLRVLGVSLLVAPGLALTATLELPVVSMDAALRTKLPTVDDLAWVGSSHALIASRREPEATTETLQQWQLADGTSTTLGAGSKPAVSPDGRWLVYLDDKRWKLRSLSDGHTIAIGEDAPFAPLAFAPPVWSRDSRYIAIIDTLRPAPAPLNVEPQQQEGVHFVDVARVADSVARQSDDKPRITIVDIRQPQRSREIPIEETHLYYGDWGNGAQLYFTAMQGFWKGAQPYTAIKRLDAATGEITELYRIAGGFIQGSAPRVSPDGRYVAVALDIDNRRWDDFNSLVLIETRSGALTRLTRDHYVASGSYRWAGNNMLYFIARHGGLDRIHRVRLDGGIATVGEGPRRHYDLGLSRDGQWLSYQTEDGYGRKDVRVRSTRNGEERVVVVLSDPARDFRLGEFKQVRWRSTDDLEIHGYVFLPPDFQPDRKYPLYVDVHGGGPAARLYLAGPLSLALASTPLEWHAWAALGYVVFVPDMRSSGEYGARVAAARYAARDWDFTGIGKDAEDIETGTRWMLRQGYIDSRRVAVFGHSAGGGRVNLLLTRSSLYGAGIIHDPVPAGALANALILTSGRNTGVGFDESYMSTGMRLGEEPAAFLGFLFDGYKSKTPTLIMVGDPDKGAIDTLSSEVLFSMLRQSRVPAKMLRYVDEGHNPTSAASALHRFHEIRRWLEEHIPASGS